ncbi:MAG: hypothetical protein GX372_03925 [Ignavibacteria bacterium]|nr:hypothetical protein [Ignavibacteria bacterium]
MKITPYNKLVNTKNNLEIKHKKENIEEMPKENNIQDNIDTLDVSLDISKMDSIRAKIRMGYYNDPGIIRETAAKLLKELGEF